MLHFTIIITFTVIATTPYLTSNGADLAHDMINNNIYINLKNITFYRALKGKVRREAIIESVLSCLPLIHSTINFIFEHFATAIGFY